MIKTATGKLSQSAQHSQQLPRCSQAIHLPERRTENNFLLIEYGQSPNGGTVQQAFIHHAGRRTMDKR